MPKYQVRATNLPSDPFIHAYLECAEWCGIISNGEEKDDDAFCSRAVDPRWTDHAIRQATQNCKDFQSIAGTLLDDIDDSQAGHDFWLTRNGHGAGFWDRGLGKTGDKLTKLCKLYGETNVWFDPETETLSFN